MNSEEEDFEAVKGGLFDALLSKSYERYETEEVKSRLSYIPPLEGISEDELPLFDEEARNILMHRDAHFSGNFDLMKAYYENEQKGAILDIAVDDIEALQLLEKELSRNLAPLILQGSDAEKIARVKKLYFALRDQCDTTSSQHLKAIAELILSEEEPAVDAKEIAKCGQEIIPFLIQLLETPELYDPLFPGYAQAPIAAAIALGLLKAKKAIPSLFLLIGNTDFEIESAALSALSAIGEEAKQFCLKAVKARPITADNERAAIALAGFDVDDEIKKTVEEQLQDPEVRKRNPLHSYLELVVET